MPVGPGLAVTRMFSGTRIHPSLPSSDAPTQPPTAANPTSRYERCLNMTYVNTIDLFHTSALTHHPAQAQNPLKPPQTHLSYSHTASLNLTSTAPSSISGSTTTLPSFPLSTHLQLPTNLSPAPSPFPPSPGALTSHPFSALGL